MKLTDKIKDRIPGLENYYNQKAFIFRNRGSSTALEIVDAVRIKYSDKPDVHELSTGEKIPAVPKDYIGNMYGGGSYFMAVEASDDQLVIFSPRFDFSTLSKVEDELDTDELQKKGLELGSNLEGDDMIQRLQDKDYNVVKFSVLDNRDERFTFYSNELETADNKYSLGHMIWDNMDLVLPVVAAVAVAIVMYTMTGDIVPAITNFGEQLANFNQNIVELQEALNQTAVRPPGQ